MDSFIRSRVFLVRTFSLASQPQVLSSVVSSTSSPVWKRKVPLSSVTSSTNNDTHDLLGEQFNHGFDDKPMSPSSTASSDRDSLSLQSTSSESNTSSMSNRTSATSIELQQRPLLLIEHQPVLQEHERLARIRTDDTYRRRCYRAGLNIFNK
jgi:hypothetical protein